VRERVARYRDALGLDGDRGIGPVSDAAGAPAQPGPRSRVDALARELHGALVAPVAAHLPGGSDTRLVVVPHDALWLLPFAALTDGSRFLGEDLGLVLATSEADWRDGAVRARPGTASGRAWIVGNPLMEPRIEACGDSYAFSPLPGAAREASAIAALFGDGRSDLFVGDQADRLRLDAWHGDYAVIHLATHGVVCPDRPLDSFVLLAALDEGDVVLDVRAQRLTRAGDPRLPVTLEGMGPATIPGSLPGLSDEPLTDGPGRREPMQGFVYPGLLDARTLASRYRLNADLVTLSACQTGLGAVLGEGVIGLSRALLAAGARSVLLSLWRVDDAATENLMVAFYRRYLAHGDKAAALRQAMAETRERFPHPRDWAGFVLLGAAE
jgi:CHAT domain-containing protein